MLFVTAIFLISHVALADGNWVNSYKDQEYVCHRGKIENGGFKLGLNQGPRPATENDSSHIFRLRAPDIETAASIVSGYSANAIASPLATQAIRCRPANNSSIVMTEYSMIRDGNGLKAWSCEAGTFVNRSFQQTPEGELYRNRFEVLAKDADTAMTVLTMGYLAQNSREPGAIRDPNFRLRCRERNRSGGESFDNVNHQVHSCRRGNMVNGSFRGSWATVNGTHGTQDFPVALRGSDIETVTAATTFLNSVNGVNVPSVTIGHVECHDRQNRPQTLPSQLPNAR